MLICEKDSLINLIHFHLHILKLFFPWKNLHFLFMQVVKSISSVLSEGFNTSLIPFEVEKQAENVNFRN